MSHFNLIALTAPSSSKDGLTHAVLQSVFNQGEATQNDRARMQSDERGGGWMEAFINEVGSRDWTLKREKVTEQTLGRAKRFLEEALTWLVDDKHVKAVTVEVFKVSATTIGRTVTLTLIDDSKFEVPL